MVVDKLENSRDGLVGVGVFVVGEGEGCVRIVGGVCVGVLIGDFVVEVD